MERKRGYSIAQTWEKMPTPCPRHGLTLASTSKSMPCPRQTCLTIAPVSKPMHVPDMSYTGSHNVADACPDMSYTSTHIA
ncbi:Arachidonate 12-lipoxygenase, 12S-type [Gossypium arboreum]|uniref:Arachidonate 12-lipoxygenase, 12S-type n=1 Tax=Gossypium arboreum TaxID=29729 RepID=A0A0B0PE49_GOSAR|nr:Arachidonate 12-lipoxygenase, 12S-type [Gossypium arboreum]